MEKYFWGYRREQGKPGVRNNLLVVATVSCVNHVVQEIAAESGGIPLTHNYGCMEPPNSLKQTKGALLGALNHPNTGAALIVGLGCEQIDAALLAELVKGKPVRMLSVQEAGGSWLAIEKGILLAEELIALMGKPSREVFPISELSIGVVCGASDWTTAIASNPVVGKMSDLVVEAGGTVAMTETSGISGTERILASRAANSQVAEAIYEIAAYHAQQARLRYGCSLHEINPSPGNKRGGLTTMVEKGMGNNAKIGNGIIQGVVDWGCCIPGPKVWIMKDSGIGPDVFSVAGLGLGGCQIIVFTTGVGSPLGSALGPVIKVTGNGITAQSFAHNIDFDASTAISSQETIEEAGQRLFALLLQVADGAFTKSEMLGHREFGIPRAETD